MKQDAAENARAAKRDREHDKRIAIKKTDVTRRIEAKEDGLN